MACAGYEGIGQPSRAVVCSSTRSQLVTVPLITLDKPRGAVGVYVNGSNAAADAVPGHCMKDKEYGYYDALGVPCRHCAKMDALAETLSN
mgnify:CR=1 FL=1